MSLSNNINSDSHDIKSRIVKQDVIWTALSVKNGTGGKFCIINSSGVKERLQCHISFTQGTDVKELLIQKFQSSAVDCFLLHLPADSPPSK